VREGLHHGRGSGPGGSGHGNYRVLDGHDVYLLDVCIDLSFERMRAPVEL